jgi:hypothetical protein
MMTTFQLTEASPSQSLWMMTPDHTIKLPGTTGSSELASPSRKIRVVTPKAVVSIQVIVQYDAETLSDWKYERVVCCLLFVEGLRMSGGIYGWSLNP